MWSFFEIWAALALFLAAGVAIAYAFIKSTSTFQESGVGTAATAKAVRQQRAAKGKKNALLFVGPCDGGKTVLFHQLRHKVFVETHTSMIENAAEFTIPTSSGSGSLWHVVDVPGASRVCESILRDYLPQAAAMVFVVDGRWDDSSAKLREAADLLYRVLSSKSAAASDNPFPILIAVNKSDLMATSIDAVGRAKKGLQKELNELWQSRSGSVAADTDEDGEQQEYPIGIEGEPFTFESLANDVHFGAISAKSGQLDSFQSFLDNVSV